MEDGQGKPAREGDAWDGFWRLSKAEPGVGKTDFSGRDASKSRILKELYAFQAQFKVDVGLEKQTWLGP